MHVHDLDPSTATIVSYFPPPADTPVVVEEAMAAALESSVWHWRSRNNTLKLSPLSASRQLMFLHPILQAPTFRFPTLNVNMDEILATHATCLSSGLAQHASLEPDQQDA